MEPAETRRPTEGAAVDRRRPSPREAVAHVETNPLRRFHFNHLADGHYPIALPVSAHEEPAGRRVAITPRSRQVDVGTLQRSAGVPLRLENVIIPAHPEISCNALDRRVCNVGRDVPGAVGSARSLVATVSDLFNSLKERTLIDTPALHDDYIPRRNSRVLFAGLVHSSGRSAKNPKTMDFDSSLQPTHAI
ncbi:MAG TPA: hypothetical protein VGM73_16545 [Candidatus Didemnitutus sp.]